MLRCFVQLAAAFSVVCVLGGFGLGEPPAKSLNEQVVDFAKGKLGKKVDDGQCGTLVLRALGAAGASEPSRIDLDTFAKEAKKFVDMGGPPPAPLPWGTEIRLGDLKPGDIIQFTNCRFVHGDKTYYDLKLHTAIVNSVKGSIVTFMSQNFQNVGEDNDPEMLMKVKVTDFFAGPKPGQKYPIKLDENTEGSLKYGRPMK